jgi:hypothetical protein
VAILFLLGAWNGESAYAATASVILFRHDFTTDKSFPGGFTSGIISNVPSWSNNTYLSPNFGCVIYGSNGLTLMCSRFETSDFYQGECIRTNKTFTVPATGALRCDVTLSCHDRGHSFCGWFRDTTVGHQWEADSPESTGLGGDGKGWFHDSVHFTQGSTYATPFNQYVSNFDIESVHTYTTIITQTQTIFLVDGKPVGSPINVPCVNQHMYWLFDIWECPGPGGVCLPAGAPGAATGTGSATLKSVVIEGVSNG